MKSIVYRSMAAAGTCLPGLIRPDVPNSLRVLMYHKISTVRPNTLAITPQTFEAQQAYLHEHYTVISPDELEAHIVGDASLPARAVLLTFDDGYRDNLVEAGPILERYGHRAILFVPTQFVGSTTPLPHDRRLAVRNPTASWDELRRSQRVFEIGSHGCSHRVLTRMPLSEARSEIHDSKRTIEDRLSTRVRAFSYPKGGMGDLNAQLEETVASAGYRLAFNTIARVNRSPIHPLRLARHNVEDFGLPYFERLLDGSADLLSVKDTRVGYEGKRVLNRVRGRLN